MTGVGFLGVLVFGGAEIIAGDKTIGQFMSFFTAMSLAFEPLRRLGLMSGQWQTAAASIERIQAILNEKPTLISPANPKAPPIAAPEIKLIDVALNYGDLPVLRGTSFTAAAGKTTALVGASGAGKSTIFNVLTRLVDPASGSVTIDDTANTEMSLPDLRGLFSVVSQDAALFDETLRDNILLGRTNVSDTDLAHVLDAAHVSDFLAQMPGGLDSPAGPRGSNLSGGQRQRIAIARALLRDTPVLLLDEATSALDTKSEAIVQNALESLSNGRTTLVIAHRLSTVRNAHSIVVMDQGRVVDQGTHDELLARGGIYADLHKLQFSQEKAQTRMTDRTVLSLTGSDRIEFLQGLVTNDVTRAKDGIIYTALLTPQGKFIADFFVVGQEDRLADRCRHQRRRRRCFQRLSMYRLRADVQISRDRLSARVSQALGLRLQGCPARPAPRSVGLACSTANTDVSDQDAIGTRCALRAPDPANRR